MWSLSSPHLTASSHDIDTFRSDVDLFLSLSQDKKEKFLLSLPLHRHTYILFELASQHKQDLKQFITNWSPSGAEYISHYWEEAEEEDAAFGQLTPYSRKEQFYALVFGVFSDTDHFALHQSILKKRDCFSRDVSREIAATLLGLE